ncbi:MAG: hypothetical protein H6Q43_2290 [Deltaproteobacteria bacterium]|nr:hypothetical protein [Deltaproteobacteria bacterium]
MRSLFHGFKGICLFTIPMDRCIPPSFSFFLWSYFSHLSSNLSYPLYCFYNFFGIFVQEFLKLLRTHVSNWRLDLFHGIDKLLVFHSLANGIP